MQISNKSALHCAVAKNDVDVLKVILEFKPNLEIKVSTMHHNTTMMTVRCNRTPLMC